MPVTIKQIAAETGLSVPTVGNVLGRSAHLYSAATREKITRTARDLGYRPNASAKSMSTGRFGCAVLVLSRQHRLSDMPQSLIGGLEEELVQNDMHLSLVRLPVEDFVAGAPMPKALRETLADGLIMNYTHCLPRQMLDLIELHRTPTVWVNVKLPHDCVHPDDLAGATVATRELVALGHRRIAFLHWNEIPDDCPPIGEGPYAQSEHYSVAERTAGYRTAMVQAGLMPLIPAETQVLRYDQYIPFCRALLQRPDRPTALIAYSQTEAESALLAAFSLDLRVPEDLSILLYGSSPTSRTAGVRFTMMMVPAEEEGRRAVRMLMRKIDSPAVPLPAEAIPLRWTPGETVGPVHVR